LKLQAGHLFGSGYPSLPAWGEWIEIPPERSGATGAHASLPAWGEWIEISDVFQRQLPVYVSLPAWGEWIEIKFAPMMIEAGIGLSPHGESGLKLSHRKSTAIIV